MEWTQSLGAKFNHYFQVKTEYTKIVPTNLVILFSGEPYFDNNQDESDESYSAQSLVVTVGRHSYEAGFGVLASAEETAVALFKEFMAADFNERECLRILNSQDYFTDRWTAPL